MIALILLVSIVLGLLINWVLIKYSVNLGVRNISAKEEIRWKRRKPSVGGLSFYLIFLILYSLLSNLVNLNLLSNISFDFNKDLSLLVAGTTGFVIGLIDDARNTNPLLKLLGQFCSGLILVLFHHTTPFSSNEIWNGILTILWTIFLMNSINMLDNMDGLTSLITVIILGGTIGLLGMEFKTFSTLMIVVSIGSLIGFLYFNWQPARIYMGDSGSQYLGIFLAHISIFFLWQNKTLDGGYFQLNQIFLPFLFFTIPIFDTTTVTIHRLLRRQSPFVGGKDHLSHHLVYLGFKDWQAVTILGIINSIFIILAIAYYKSTSIPIIFITWIACFAVLQFFYIKADNKKRLSASNI